MPEHETAEAVLLLGGSGCDSGTRLGVGAEVRADEVYSAGLGALDRWRRRAESPFASRRYTAAVSVLIRTCERLMTEPSEHRPFR